MIHFWLEQSLSSIEMGKLEKGEGSQGYILDVFHLTSRTVRYAFALYK